MMLGISTKNRNILLKYLVGLHIHLLKKVIRFKPGTIDEAYVQEKYMKNIGHKKGQASGLKHK
jgi:hypothetical protein